jgi:phosphonopyruvate decarboxylase
MTMQVINQLKEHGIDFIVGVPCSIFKDFLKEVDKDDYFTHIVATREDEAIAIATGYHLATGKMPLVYMQNSGFWNALDPLTSLTDLYKIPMLIFISERGYEGDAEQHILTGKMYKGVFDLICERCSYPAINDIYFSFDEWDLLPDSPSYRIIEKGSLK